jgi:hypothetical protein
VLRNPCLVATVPRLSALAMPLFVAVSRRTPYDLRPLMLAVLAPLTPPLGERKSFMGKGRIPALPSFIICPPTLIAQWRSELDRWVAKTACHIIEYRGNDAECKIFFEKGSPYDKAVNGKYAERTIVLVETPVKYPQASSIPH